MPRPRNLDLSRQQRRVLELMARGRTNFEISQDLGVSLEGAKYHIRQVFDKLGVDSREEAVAAWHASRGSLFERVRGWLWPVGAVAAGGVVVIAAIVVSAIALGGGSSDASNQVWVAAISDGGTLTAFNASHTDAQHAFAGHYDDAGSGYTRVKWSPDGHYLTVSGTFDGSNPQLMTFTRSSSGWSGTPTISPEGAWFAWSPDSTMLAAFGTQSTLTDADGKVITQFDAPLDPSEDALSIGPISWAPDSHAFAGSINNLLIVVGPAGGLAFALPGGVGSGGFVVRWSDPDTIVVVNSSTSIPVTSKTYEVHLDGDSARWVELHGDAASSPAAVLPTPDEAVTALWHDPRDGVAAAVGRTTDGSGTIYGPALGYPLDPAADVNYHIVVEPSAGRPVPIEFGEMSILGVAGPNRAYDIVITT